ncbi:putative transposable element-related protein [Cucumis melo var. makuwa]|uniref:Transposable element-related protein n=1 Tax=Cucumis melo var. makuwa TaxID=1194695 RepID=A0A5A7US63_CUCMM|nr:putative transposable element-related protein [Cucumis melo var. makuwa]TYK29156.1 putative transposable element-related protein [Cucumis melo var. makuwa]
MALVAHFDLELHQMDVKTVFLNGNIDETICQCPKITLEIKEMQKVPYASAVGSLMYAQICTRPDIAFIVGVLGKYLRNSMMDHLLEIRSF